MQFFEERVKLEYSGGKPVRAEKRTNKLNPRMTPSLGIEPGPHWWEASALTTTPPLLSCNIFVKITKFKTLKMDAKTA